MDDLRDRVLRGDLVEDIRRLLERGADDHWAWLRANVRHALGLRHQDAVAVSALTGLAPGTVRGFLNGRPSSIRNVLLIAEATGYTIGELDRPPDEFRQRAQQAAVDGAEAIGRPFLAFEKAATGMAILLLDGTIVKVNQRLRELLGYAEAELIGAPGSNFLVRTEAERSAQLAEWAARNVISGGSTPLRRKDGTLVEALISAVVVRDDAQEPRYIIARAVPVARAVESSGKPPTSVDESPNTSDSVASDGETPT